MQPDPNEKSMVLNPLAWPKWPTLPVKRRDAEDVTGIVLAREPFGQRVYVGNVYGLQPAPYQFVDGRAVPLKFTDYDSVDEMLKVWTIQGEQK